MANIFEINRVSNKITLGTTDTIINVASHTASRLLALDASKNLEVVTIGSSLDYTRPTLNTIQDIRTSASPYFTGIELGHTTDTTITRVSAGVVAIEGTTIMLVGDAPTSHIHDGRYYTETEIDNGFQPLDAELTSLAGLSYAAASFVKMTGANTFALRTIGQTADDLEGTIDHNQLANYASNKHFTQANITATGTITSGTWQGTTIAINQGGTGQTSAQAAINALSAVSGATNEHVLTKDTASGNAIFKVVTAGADEKVKIDVAATAGYIGAASGDGVLRTTTGLSYTDGGNFVTLGLSHLGIESLTDPNVDRVMFWDDSTTALKWLTVMEGVQINGTKLQFDVNSLTEITSVDGATDYVVVFDTSEANPGYEHKKVLLNNTRLPGETVQVVNYQTGAVDTGSTIIPFNDTIPQNNEGDEYMTLAITPTNASNKLKIEVVFFGTLTVNGGQLIVTLFQDDIANALATGAHISYINDKISGVKFTYYMPAGTISAITFKVRAGGHTAGTLTFNGIASNRRFGGTFASSITITEIQV